MKALFREYFTFNKSERKGIIILISVIIIVASLPHFVKRDESAPDLEDSDFKVEIEEFLNDSGSSDSVEEDINSQFKYRTSRFRPHPFDPNTATQQEFMKMGFSEKQASSIINYRAKGGSFKIKQDFAKLYVVDDETYRLFEPFIDLPVQPKTSNEVTSGTKSTSKQTYSYPSENSLTRVELNTADSVDLITVKGIGPVFASRILKFRNKAGGFNDIAQLLDVYGIDSAKYLGLAPQVSVDTTKVIRIDINHVTLENLKSHPYLNYYTAKAIIDKRIQRGKLKSSDELADIFRTRPELYKKLIPYLEFKD